jgi:hypothetical protein
MQWSLFPSGLWYSISDIIFSSLVIIRSRICGKAIWSYIKSKSREEIGDLHLNPEDTNSEKNR